MIAWAEGSPLTRNGKSVTANLASATLDAATNPPPVVFVSQDADKNPQANSDCVRPTRYIAWLSVLAVCSAVESEAILRFAQKPGIRFTELTCEEVLAHCNDAERHYLKRLRARIEGNPELQEEAAVILAPRGQPTALSADASDRFDRPLYRPVGRVVPWNQNDDKK